MKKELSTLLNTNFVSVKTFIICSLLVSLDPSIVIGEKK